MKNLNLKLPLLKGEQPLEDEEHFYTQAVQRILRQVAPDIFYEEKKQKASPVFCWSPILQPPFLLTFYLWCPYRQGAFRFFSEMVTRWLIPGERINITAQFACDFTFSETDEAKQKPQIYTVGEVTVPIGNLRELSILQKTLPLLQHEISLGLPSYALERRIIEAKGLNLDEKSLLIQENSLLLIKHRPQDFDYDLLVDVQHFLFCCCEEFKEVRSWRHMSRIICVHYLFRQALKFSLEVYPDKREISCKLIRASLSPSRRVLGVALAMSFLKETEYFDEHHFLQGIQALVPDALGVKGSFFQHPGQHHSIQNFYLEIEKKSGEMLSLEEERLLKEGLPAELKGRIEQRLNPIFMPQNEEVIMRHILTLSSQLKYVRDLPQVILEFSKQTVNQLEFLVIALRVATETLFSFESLFQETPSSLEYLPDRTKCFGHVRKKYPKEAHVCRLRIDKAPFLRRDHAVDLTKARLFVADELHRVIGEFRDYNGGTLSKEMEVFEGLREELGYYAEANGELLENFFYSIHPPLMRSLLPVEPLKKLFYLLLEASAEGLSEDEPYQIRIAYAPGYVFMVLGARDLNFKENLLEALKPFKGKVALTTTQEPEHSLISLLYQGDNEEETLALRLKVESAIAESYSVNLLLGYPSSNPC